MTFNPFNNGNGGGTSEDTVARAEIAAIKDGETLDSFGDVENALADKANIIDIPTTAADVSALPDTTKYAATLSLTINSSTFIITGQLKDQDGNNLGTAQTIDLPLESVVVGGSYDDTTKKVILTLQNGNTVEFSVADLVSGLQTELSASNKLNPAYINYDSTHRAVSDTEKATWNGKQSALTSAQLAAVNSGIDSTKVAQINTNQTNIGKVQTQANWNTNNGVKNLLDLSKYKELNPSIVSGDNLVFHGVTWSISNSSGLTASGTADSSGSYPSIYSATLPIGTYYLTGGDSTIELLTPDNRRESGQGLTIEITASTAQPYAIRGYVPPSTAITGTHNIKPMLRQVGDSTYEPYALPNTKITPELIELVDSGAKNLYNPTQTSTTISGLTGTVTRNSDGSYTISGTTSGTVYYNMGSWITPEDGYYILSGGSAAESNSQLIYDDHDWQTYESGNKKKLAYWTKGSTHNLYIRLGSGITLSNVTFYPMICTKAAWDVSQKYVPYRPTYEETVEQVATNKNNILLLQQQVGYANTELEGVL